MSIKQKSAALSNEAKSAILNYLDTKDERYLEAIGGVRYSEVTKDMAVGKRVCILGNGNAGMEVAQNIYQLADRVFFMGKHPVRVSAVTKYTGDVRVKFLQSK